LNLIGHVNRMDSNRKVSQVFNNNPKGSRLGDDQKTDVGTVSQILIEAKLKTGKREQATELTGRSSDKGMHRTVVPSKKRKKN